MQRSQIQTEFFFSWDPSRFSSDIFLKAFQKFMSIEFWKSNPLGRKKKSVNIAFRSEKSNLAIVVLISFHSFKALYSIMQRRVERMDRERTKRNNLWLLPT